MTTIYELNPRLGLAVEPPRIERVGKATPDAASVEFRVSMDMTPVFRDGPDDEWQRVEQPGIEPEGEDPGVVFT